MSLPRYMTADARSCRAVALPGLSRRSPDGTTRPERLRTTSRLQTRLQHELNPDVVDGVVRLQAHSRDLGERSGNTEAWSGTFVKPWAPRTRPLLAGTRRRQSPDAPPIPSTALSSSTWSGACSRHHSSSCWSRTAARSPAAASPSMMRWYWSLTSLSIIPALRSSPSHSSR